MNPGDGLKHAWMRSDEGRSPSILSKSVSATCSLHKRVGTFYRNHKCIFIIIYLYCTWIFLKDLKMIWEDYYEEDYRYRRWHIKYKRTGDVDHFRYNKNAEPKNVKEF